MVCEYQIIWGQSNKRNNLNRRYSKKLVIIFDTIILIKIVVTISVVITLSLVAERVSTSVAGVLSGYPLGVAIVLFFYGLEVSPEFAAKSAVYTMPGLISTQSFVYFYYRASKLRVASQLFLSSVVAVVGFLAVGWVVQQFQFNLFLSVLVPIGSILFFLWIFKQIPIEQIQKPVAFSHRVFALRAGLAAFVIIVITGVGKFAGPGWAGVLSAFPSTLFPLLVIVNLTYDIQHVYTIIKNFPLGLGSIIVYAFIVSLVYPVYGIYSGTIMAFVGATAYLVLLQMAATLWKQDI